MECRTKVHENYPMDNNKIILCIWEGDYGLGSIQPESLVIMTYLKFTGLPTSFEVSNMPLLHSLPNLTFSGIYLESYDSIFGIIYKMNHSVDQFLSIFDMSRLRAYRSYYKSELALLFYTTFWIMDENYYTVTRTWYRNAMKFPFGYIYTYVFRKKLQNEYSRVATMGRIEIVIHASLKRGCEIIDELSNMLGEKEYLYSETETSLDAVVFGYIAPLLNAPLKDQTIPNHIHSKPNIVQWCNRITNKFHKNVSKEFKYVSKYKPSLEKEDDASKGFIISAGIIVGVAMLGYATLCGIIRFSGHYGFKWQRKISL